MFAGPNGSGKSTVKEIIVKKNPRWFGVYINPDEIEKAIEREGLLDFGLFKVKTNNNEIFDALNNSTVLADKGLLPEVSKLAFDKNILSFQNVHLNSYYISAVADFLHEKLVASGTSFSFETVMSHPKKIELLRSAQAKGFRTYLYFVATEDPETNIDRVRIRVMEGGHDVPPTKIRDRYYKSLTNLLSAIKATHRAFIFDNSGASVTLIAEITNGKNIFIENSNVPNWFRKYVLKKRILFRNRITENVYRPVDETSSCRLKFAISDPSYPAPSSPIASTGHAISASSHSSASSAVWGCL